MLGILNKYAGQVIAAAGVERPQVRKVRASQGRMPDNVRWRNSKDSATEIYRHFCGKGGMAV